MATPILGPSVSSTTHPVFPAKWSSFCLLRPHGTNPFLFPIPTLGLAKHSDQPPKSSPFQAEHPGSLNQFPCDGVPALHQLSLPPFILVIFFYTLSTRLIINPGSPGLNITFKVKANISGHPPRDLIHVPFPLPVTWGLDPLFQASERHTRRPHLLREQLWEPVFMIKCVANPDFPKPEKGRTFNSLKAVGSKVNSLNSTAWAAADLCQV